MNLQTAMVACMGLLLGCSGGSNQPASGGTPGAGGDPGTGGTRATGGTLPGGAGAGGSVPVGGAPPAGSGLLDRIGVKDIPVPAVVKPGRSNWRIWGSASLSISPVYFAPLALCGSLVCYTSGAADSRSAPGASHTYVVRLDANDAPVKTYDLGAFECRGLAAEPDGHFGVLLWAAGTAKDCADPATSGRIYLARYDADGTQVSNTELQNTTASDPNCPTDFGIGDSRLEFGDDRYGAYYHVHSKSGHEGDTLKYVTTAGATTTTWAWGCSHSMSNLLRFHPTDKKFMPACVTDCYPGTAGSDYATVAIGGVYTSNRNKILDVDGGCNGSVAGELGGAAVASSGWKMVFNAHQAPATKGQSSYSTSTMNQDIGFVSIAPGLTASGGVVWLTSTASVNEADSGIERWQPTDDATPQFVVGWSEPGTTYRYKMARVDGSGAFLEGPVDVSAKVKWGRRDDPFRAHANGDVGWAWFDGPGSTTLRVGRLRSGGAATCP